MSKEPNAQNSILLVGPYPPPHGGISVHVRNAHALFTSRGVRCEVLNTGKVSRGKLLLSLARYARRRWTFHVHTNGHNPKSWVVALAGGIAARLGRGGVLTLHSGFVPEFLQSCGIVKRALARLACRFYGGVVCVNPDIADAVALLGVSRTKLEVRPAYLPGPQESVDMPPQITEWLKVMRPVISTALSFRPEYGFDLLVDAIERLRAIHPNIGCLVMGDGEERRAAEELIRRRGLEGVMLLTGDVGHSLCLALMSRSDVFVRTTYQDGDAISVREALAAGVPVAASDVGVRPSGVELFEPGDLDGLVRVLKCCLSGASDPSWEGGGAAPTQTYDATSVVGAAGEVS
jgi:glycosyltransferase involved in cell wall biosynthesis